MKYVWWMLGFWLVLLPLSFLVPGSFYRWCVWGPLTVIGTALIEYSVRSHLKRAKTDN